MISTVVDLTEAPPTGTKTVLLFWAPWHEGSAGPMTQVLEALAAANPTLSFARIQAEQVPTVSQRYQVTVVPTFCFLDEAGTVVERMEGAEDVAQVTQAVSRLEQRAAVSASPTSPTTPKQLSAEDQLTVRLQTLIGSSEVMLFMKGVPTAPRCGFSKQVVEMMQDESIDFGSFDILQDDAVRQGLKKHSDWPTYPQLYVRGELVGGLDILKEMKEEDGDLRKQLGLSESSSQPPVSSLEDRLKQLTHQSKVMLFMKGLPSAPRCGFSRQMVEILDNAHVAYDAFDILQDEEVRQGLKTFSDWPTYPQLYVGGDLVGGLDIVKEMKDDGSLNEVLNPPE